jgi:sec-independent protein translocase protein TatA
VFNLGAPELILIMVLALIIFGPKRLPELGRTLGKGLAEFRKASNDLKRSIENEIHEVDEAQRPQVSRLPSRAPAGTAAAGEVAEVAEETAPPSGPRPLDPA